MGEFCTVRKAPKGQCDLANWQCSYPTCIEGYKKPESKPQEGGIDSTSRPWPFHHFPEDRSTWKCVQREYDDIKKERDKLLNELTERNEFIDCVDASWKKILNHTRAATKDIMAENKKLREALESLKNKWDKIEASKTTASYQIVAEALEESK